MLPEVEAAIPDPIPEQEAAARAIIVTARAMSALGAILMAGVLLPAMVVLLPEAPQVAAMEPVAVEAITAVTQVVEAAVPPAVVAEAPAAVTANNTRFF